MGEMVVSCGRFNDGPAYFHPGCFLCSQCGELLIDLRAHVDIGKVCGWSGGGGVRGIKV